MAGERTFLVKILGNADGAITAFKKLQRQGRSLQDDIGEGLGKSLNFTFDAFQKVAAVGAVAIGAVSAASFIAVQKASDLNETISKSQQIFGDASREIRKFADDAASSLGQTKQQAIDAAATFGIFGKSAGLSGQALADFSTKFVTLASDLSSFNNTSPEEAIQAIGAALRGEAEPIRSFGVLMNDAALKQVALEMGIYSGNGALTAQQKVLASSELLFKQTSDAQGDFERTSGGLANQQKILKASLDNITTTIGTLLLPVFVNVVTFINKYIIPAFTAFADHVGKDGLVGALGFAMNTFGDFGFTVIDTAEMMTMSMLEFLKTVLEVARNIALTVGVTAALTGNVGLTLKSVAASKALGYAQDYVNGALAKTPGIFDSIRIAMVRAQVVSQNTLPSIIGTADALERQAKKGGAVVAVSQDIEKVTKTVGKAVDTAKEKMQKYTDALKGSTHAQNRFTSAQRGTIEAQKNLDKANTDVTNAQEALNQAVAGYGKDSTQAKDAQRDLDKANRGVERAGYRVEQSLFAVTDAEKKLAELRADPESSPQAIREAELSLAEAKLSVRDATDAQFDATNGLAKAQDDLNRIVNGAIIGSIFYNGLLKDLNDAKESQTDASIRVADAILNEKDAYESLAEAIKKVADAAAQMPNANLAIPTLPTVPVPFSGMTSTAQTGGGTNIVINTGIGTSGVEAGRQIVEFIQQYSKIAADPLGINARQ